MRYGFPLAEPPPAVWHPGRTVPAPSAASPARKVRRESAPPFVTSNIIGSFLQVGFAELLVCVRLQRKRFIEFRHGAPPHNS
jgi:hypothetical protein